MKAIRILPGAASDLEAAADFYESQRQGLGVEFAKALIADVDRLSLHGGVHVMYQGFHRAISKRFPFAIYYLLDGDVVSIYAVLDCRRDPDTTNAILDSR